MKAVILAGGSGKKLYPLTYDTPKPMVSFFSEPILGYILGQLKEEGFDEVHLALGYMAERAKQYAEGLSSENFRIICHTETQPLGTAGAVREAAREINEPFLVISSDVVCDFRLGEIMDFHLTHNADVTVVCSKADDPRECSIIEFDASDNVKSFTEKPTWSCVNSDCVSTGIYVLNPDVTDFVPEGCETDLLNDVFPALMKLGRCILSCRVQGYWCDIDTPSDFLGCLWDVLDMKTGIRLPVKTGGVYSQDVLAAGDYSIIEPCYIGRNVTVARGAVIGPYAVINNGCRIGEKAKIVRSCMLDNSSLGASSSLNGAILCHNSSVRAGCSIAQGAVIGTGASVGSSSDVGGSVIIPPNSSVEASGRISGSVRYARTALSLNDSNRFCSYAGRELDPVNAVIIGQALASMEIGRKTGIVTDGRTLSRAFAHCLAGAMTAHSSRVWSFSDGFQPQLEFYVRFCSLKSGIFVSSDGGRVSICICGENGLELSEKYVRELENRIKYRDFLPCTAENCRDVSDMSGVAMMYRREIIRQTETELSDVSCIIKCPNDKITSLLEDCLYQLGCRTGDEITFKINMTGNLLSAFSRECGWLNHDKLSAILLNYESANGRDISVSYDSPCIFDDIALKNGRRLYRYRRSAADGSDSVARELSRQNPYMRDAVLMAVRLLGIICTTGRSLAALARDIPDFYVARRKIPISFPPSALRDKLSDRKIEITGDGIAVRYPQGRVLLTASRSGRSLSMLSESASYEISGELCADIEKLLKGKK